MPLTPACAGRAELLQTAGGDDDTTLAQEGHNESFGQKYDVLDLEQVSTAAGGAVSSPTRKYTLSLRLGSPLYDGDGPSCTSTCRQAEHAACATRTRTLLNDKAANAKRSPS